MAELHGCVLTHVSVHPCQFPRYRLNVHGHLHTGCVTEQGYEHYEVKHNPPADLRYRCVSAERQDLRPRLLAGVLAVTRVSRGTAPKLLRCGGEVRSRKGWARELRGNPNLVTQRINRYGWRPCYAATLPVHAAISAGTKAAARLQAGRRLVRVRGRYRPKAFLKGFTRLTRRAAVKDLGLYFELHLTIDPQHRDAALTVLAVHGWHYSALKGDEVLGPDVRGYLTVRTASLTDAWGLLADACAWLDWARVPWVRRKIEVAILDEVA